MKLPNYQITKLPNHNIWKQSIKALLAFSFSVASLATATAQTWNTSAAGNYTQGNLGVGTTTVPTNEKLRVEGKLFTQNLQLGTSSTPNYFLGTGGTTGDVSLINPATTLWSMGGNQFGGTAFIGSPTGWTSPLKFNTNGITRLNISGLNNTTVGNVTVGDVARNPYFWKFEVNGGRTALIGPDNTNGTYDQTNILQVVSNWNPTSNNTLQNFASSGSIQHYLSLSHERFNNNEEHGVINCYQYTNPSGPGVAKQLILQKNSGNVGIGNFTSAPTTKLDVQGDIKASGDIIYDGNKSVRNLMASGTGSSLWKTNTTNTNNIYYNTGVVAIGTDNIPNTDYMLRVNGKILAKGLKCQVSGWPDYVFDKEYKMLTLDSLKAFVTSEKHLPEIPSQKEVESNGVELVEMNKMLLKKVEELTLYMIQLEDRLKKVENDEKH